MFSKEAIALAKSTVEAIKKISKGKWEWEPRKGEFVLRQPLGEVDLITRALAGPPHGMLRLSPEAFCLFFDKHRSNFIPILHWETIEKNLEGMGYVFEEPIRRCYGSEGFKCHCVISLNGKRVGWGWDKSRQLAVMRAVIELGKE